MNYIETVNWLFNNLANYQNQGGSAYKPGLDNINRLLSHLGNPHQSIKTVHIAGTNGKGSTAHILSSILIENGYKTGLFTSPHIKDFRERIKINGQLSKEQFVIDFVKSHQTFLIEINASFFEITTAMAFQYFKEEECDVAIIETGLGGRLDATNVLLPECSLITNIGIDHTQFLGDTIEKIAFEKAGIIKKNIPVVIGETNKASLKVFKEVALKQNSELTQAGKRIFYSELLGQYQQKNINLAWDCTQVLKELGWYIDDMKSLASLNSVYRNTGFSGRLQKISSEPQIIIDASHNLDGVKTLLKEIEDIQYNKLICVYGASNDKDYKAIMAELPNDAKYFLTSFDSSRAVSKEELKVEGNLNGLDYELFSGPELAFQSAKSIYNTGDLILVFGSFYILEKII